MGSLNKKNNFKKIAKEVIDLEIKALQKLKKSLNKNFDKAVNAIVNCQSKVFYVELEKVELLLVRFQQLFLQLEHHHFLFQQMIVHMATWVVYQEKIF